MNGQEFYEYLRINYNLNGQPLYGNFTFHDWLYKIANDSFSFRFNILNNGYKSIPRDIIIAAWDRNEIIDDHWLVANFNLNFHNDCRLHVLNFLISEYQYLR